MAAATITEMRNGLQVRLATIGIEAAARISGGSITPPCAVVEPAPGAFIAYDSALRYSGVYDVAFRIKLAVSEAETESAQILLDGFLSLNGTTSVIAALEGDRTLGGKVATLEVTGAGNYGTVVIGSTECFGCEVYVMVKA